MVNVSTVAKIVFYNFLYYFVRFTDGISTLERKCSTKVHVIRVIVCHSPSVTVAVFIEQIHQNPNIIWSYINAVIISLVQCIAKITP